MSSKWRGDGSEGPSNAAGSSYDDDVSDYNQFYRQLGMDGV